MGRLGLVPVSNFRFSSRGNFLAGKGNCPAGEMSGGMSAGENVYGETLVPFTAILHLPFA